MVYRESIILGETQLSREEVHSIVQRMGQEYKGNLYHLLQRNCNHFSDDLAFRLCGNQAPTWVRKSSLPPASQLMTAGIIDQEGFKCETMCTTL